MVTPSFVGNGDVSRIVLAMDWSSTPLGSRATWPQSLTTIVDLLLASKFPMCLGWGDDVTLIYNDAYAPFLGDKALSLGLPMSVVWEDIWSDIEPLVRQAMAGEAIAFDDLPLTMTRNGYPEETWWTFSYSPVRNDSGRICGFLNVATETTEKRKAVQQLQALNGTLQDRVAALAAERDQLWRLSRDPFVICDLDGRWLSASPVWAEILGWTDRDLIGRTSAWMEHPDDSAKTRQKVIDVGEGEIMLAFTNRFRGKDGAYRTFSWTAVSEDNRLFCVARDVTNEMARAEALRLYENIVQSDIAPVCAFDNECRLIAFNQAHSNEFFRIYGYRVRVGDVFPDLFLPEQRAIVRGFMERALTGEVFTVTEVFGDPNLTTPYWEVTYNPLRAEDGRIVGAFHHAIDITERLRAEADLGEARDALRQAQKMEAIGQLTGGVAHDFNNLLTVIRGSVDLLQRENIPTEKRQRYLNAIGETADRAAKLTGQLLAFARRQTLEPEVFDVSQRLSAITDMLDSMTGTRVLVRSEISDGFCCVRADVSQFETVLVNLVVNARDAMNGEGTIDIRLQGNVSLPRIRGHGAGRATFVAISVSDTGVGIPTDDLERIFEPFFTTKEVGRGTGLGLSQVFGFAKQSGGDVDVESAVGRGSTFTLYLPQVDTETPKAERAAAPHKTADGRGRLVLIVEDNISVGQFATQLLEDLGYRTEWVVSGEEALERLGSGDDGFDIVFSDVVMPGISGIELAKRLARERPGLPVVLASGYSHALVQEGIEGIELLRKPYSANQLSEVLQRQLSLAV